MLTRCDQCRAMWKERNDRGVAGDPPCDTCRVELLKENIIPFEIYRRITGQVRLYFDGERTREVDLDHNALWTMIDHYPGKIVSHWRVFEEVTRAYYHFLKERNKK